MLALNFCILPSALGFKRVESRDPVTDDLRCKSFLVHPVQMEHSVHRRLLVTELFNKKLKKIIGNSVQIIQTACLDEVMIDDYPDSATLDSLRVHYNATFLALSHASIGTYEGLFATMSLTVSILDLETHQYAYDQQVMGWDTENSIGEDFILHSRFIGPMPIWCEGDCEKLCGILTVKSKSIMM
jgi:hypothetical protein